MQRLHRNWRLGARLKPVLSDGHVQRFIEMVLAPALRLLKAAYGALPVPGVGTKPSPKGRVISSNGCGWNPASAYHCSAISTGLSIGMSPLARAW